MTKSLRANSASAIARWLAGWFAARWAPLALDRHRDILDPHGIAPPETGEVRPCRRQSAQVRFQRAAFLGRKLVAMQRQAGRIDRCVQMVGAAAVGAVQEPLRLPDFLVDRDDAGNIDAVDDSRRNSSGG